MKQVMETSDFVEKIASQIQNGVLQSELVSSTGLGSRTTSTLCTRLETKGLIKRKKAAKNGKHTNLIELTKDYSYEKVKEVIADYFRKLRPGSVALFYPQPYD
jgi:predicted transcriptional regulator